MNFLNIAILAAGMIYGASVALVGAWGITTRRILVLSGYWLAAFSALMIVPGIIWSLGVFYLSEFRRTEYLLIVGMLALAQFMIWRSCQGYLIYGIEAESFRTALHRALGSLGLPFGEKLSKLTLGSIGAELRVTIQPRLGFAQVGIRPAGKRIVMKRIVQTAVGFYREGGRKAKTSIFVIFLLMGLLLVGLMLLILRSRTGL